MKKILLLGLLVVAVVFLVACTPETTSSEDSSSTTDLSSGDNLAANDGKVTTTSFAQCLTDNGAEMYGAEWCSHCKNQKKEFGKAFDEVFYIECTEEKDACNAAGITGYPTWIVNGNKYPGEQSFEKLGSLTGCEVPEV